VAGELFAPGGHRRQDEIGVASVPSADLQDAPTSHTATPTPAKRWIQRILGSIVRLWQRIFGRNTVGDWDQTIWIIGPPGKDEPFRAKIDSQLTLGNLISASVVQRMQLRPTQIATKTFQTVDGSFTVSLAVTASFYGRYGSRTYQEDFYIIDTDKFDLLLGRDFMDKYPDILPRPLALTCRHMESPEEVKEKERKEKALLLARQEQQAREQTVERYRLKALEEESRLKALAEENRLARRAPSGKKKQ
jgi:hypothetical protein